MRILVVLLGLSSLAWADASVTSSAKGCDLWRGATRAALRSTGGNAAMFAGLQYDFASGEAAAFDARVKPPIEKKRKLSGAEKDRVEAALRAICPTAEQRKYICPPGGCTSLAVTPPKGDPVYIQHYETVMVAWKLLAALFPDLKNF